MDDLIVEFLTETNESLAKLDNDMIRLEQNPNDRDLLSNIFRLMHTIKGTCGFLGLPRLETVAHRAENVLGRFRDGDLSVTPAYVSLILESLDRVRYILAEIEMNQKEPEGNDNDLTAKLDAVYEGRDGGDSAAAAAPAATPAPVAESAPIPEPIVAAPEPELAAEPAPASAAVDDHHAPSTAGSPGAGAGKDAKESAVANQTLRVNVEALENLMNMVSELVLTRNQLLQTMRTQKDSEFTGPLQRLNHVVSDLQEGVMKTRMQPIGNAWSKLPRIVRDLAQELGKKIDLEMVGEDTELDRQVLEMIKDPLTHMVRNSADHGIEKIADRLAVGKAETGKIILRAFHEGGHIIIQIVDDGKGLPMTKIKQKIIANGLATEPEIAAMTDQQIQQYIFRAGFSTAEKVTSVSGRGVGMDVVRSNMEKIGGAIEMKSIEGKGSTFTIKIPLTLAIVSALMLGVDKERFAIPQLAVRELVLTSAKSENRIEMINGTPLFRLRNQLLPLISLEQLLHLRGDHAGTAGIMQSFSEGKKYIVVVQVGTYNFGLIVDRVFDTEEIVVKPVSKMLQKIEMFSGNTILGDGSVIMILDPVGLAKATGEADLSGGSDEAQSAQHAGEVTTPLLLFRAGNGAPKAVPLSLISRLENIDPKNIETASGRSLIQYRDQLMPLLPLSSELDMTRRDKPVLVFADRERSLGLIVDDIIDIVEASLDLQINSQDSGIVGSTVIAGKATDIIDVGYYLQSIDQNWFKNHDDEAFASSKENRQTATKRRLLLVDDSPFFRNMLTPILKIAGYDVTVLDSAVKALRLCEDGSDFDIIISDIEMPEMDGFEFVTKVKDGSRWASTPMVALTSHATAQDIEYGYQKGFNKYVAKFDRETLLSTLSEALSNRVEA
jgi:two-component system, chemotaxis family, sensor kinase CheA